MIKKRYTPLFPDENILFLDEYSANAITLMMLIFMNMILKLLFISEIWLGTTNISNVKHLKRNKQRIDASSMAPYNIVGLVLARRQEKRNGTIFY